MNEFYDTQKEKQETELMLRDTTKKRDNLKAMIEEIEAKNKLNNSNLNKKQNELKTLVSAFQDFYKQVYKVHDFSFASIASENTKDTKKEVLTKGLNIVKNFK